ncbi:response regulator [Desulfonatronovibrio magnus]|uniref:response regulator n=1 Tax=Desulfonatronovibrio magnus TaxID=698827 RepID=UPI0005EBEC23|nr:response regulator transcription factor [Desulfonatronovibrio magnus]
MKKNQNQLNAKLRVVLADDHQIMRHGLSLMLTLAGVEVVAEAGSPDEILQAVKHNMPDIILLDIDLESSSGLDLIEPLRSINPEIKVIVLTSDLKLSTLQKALACGVDGYQLKTTPPENLMDAMHQAMDGNLILPDGLRTNVKSSASDSSYREAECQLSEREKDVYNLLRQGATNSDIAKTLNISINTVKTHVSRIMKKFSIKRRIDLIRI